MSSRGFGRVLAGGAAVALAFGGCSLKDSGTNTVNGKTLFTEKCASCHTLKRAGATGVLTYHALDAARLIHG